MLLSHLGFRSMLLNLNIVYIVYTQQVAIESPVLHEVVQFPCYVYLPPVGVGGGALVAGLAGDLPWENKHKRYGR